MYKYFFVTILLLLSFAAIAQQSSHEMFVDGNCGMCENRIEKAALEVQGVKSAEWDSDTKMLTLKTTEGFDIMNVHYHIAGIGHDTKLIKAGDNIYDALHGCCKYRDEEHEEAKHSEDDVHEHPEEVELANTITGEIFLVEENGDTIPAVGGTLLWLGTNKGASADLDGKFSLPTVSQTRFLVVSYVGFGSDTVKVKRDKDLTILLNQGVRLNEVKLTYRRRSTDVSFTTATKTQYISTQELQKAACCNLAESFETTPAIDASVTDAVTGTRRIEMLGLAGPYVQIMRENQPYIRGLATLRGLEYIPGYWIKGMHLNTGAGSVVNGFESITGQINVALFQPQDAGPNYRFNLYGNQGGRFEVNATTKHKINDNWSMMNMVHGRYQKARNDRNNDGFLDMPLNESFYALNRWKFYGVDGWEGQAGVAGIYSNSTGGQRDFGSSDNNQMLWGSDITNRRAEAWIKTGKVFKSGSNRSMGFQLSGSYEDQDALFGIREYDATHLSLYGNFIFQSDFSKGSPHKYRTGVSYQYDNMDENVLLLLDDNKRLYSRNEKVVGAYYEYSYVPNEKWTVVAGIRADHHNNYGLFATPRFHARFSPGARTAIRVSGGRGLRTANIFAENIGAFASSRDIKVRIDQADAANPYRLRPEIAWNFGLNLTHELPLAGGRTLLLNADAYYTHFENQIIADYDISPNVMELSNLDGRSEAFTLQFQADAQLSEKWEVRLAHRFNDVKATYNGIFRQRPLVSRHRAFVNTAYNPSDKWSFDATLSWQSSRRIPSTLSNPVEYRLPLQSPSFFQLNSQVTKRFSKVFEIYVGVENALNYRQENPIIASDQPFGENFDASLVWGPIFGRNVYAGLRWEF